MNRKTATILVAAGGLAAAAAILGARPSRPHGPPPEPQAPEPPPATACGAPAPSRITADFGPGTITAALSGGHVLRAGDGEVYASIELVAREVETTNRPPMRVAIVIDHSGSMQGDKITKAREAARGLIERLSESDTAALVQYDDTAQVLVPAIAADESGKRRLRTAIDAIQDAGGTNLHDGLVLGRDEVLRNLSTGHVNRVILLSDGNANVGVTDVATLARVAADASERGVRITTVGLGIDYNEDLMEAVAENGRGQYYYVKDAGDLDRVFAGELRAIQSTVATATELRLEPACAGVEVAEVFGYVTRREGNAVVVPLADLAGGDRRKIVARIKVPVAQVGREGVLTANLRFAATAGGTRTAQASVGLEVTEDAALVEHSIDPEVLAKVEQVESATVMRQAAVAYEGGDQAGAVQMITAKRDEAKRRAAKYKMKEADLAPMYDQLDSMNAGMSATKPSDSAAPAMTKGAKAGAYMLSH